MVSGERYLLWGFGEGGQRPQDKLRPEEKESEAWEGETKDREGLWDFQSSS